MSNFNDKWAHAEIHICWAVVQCSRAAAKTEPGQRMGPIFHTFCWSGCLVGWLTLREPLGAHTHVAMWHRHGTMSCTLWAGPGGMQPVCFSCDDVNSTWASWSPRISSSSGHHGCYSLSHTYCTHDFIFYFF